LALPEFGPERYHQLAPYVAALPVGTALNVCTASGVVLDSIAPGLGQYTQGAAQLALNRQKGCFPALADIQAAAAALIRNSADRQAIIASLSDSTHYFRGKTTVSLGTTQLTLYSLFERNTNGSSRVVIRTLSTE
jgi:general secretion pathway protein K